MDGWTPAEIKSHPISSLRACVSGELKTAVLEFKNSFLEVQEEIFKVQELFKYHLPAVQENLQFLNCS